MFSVYNDADYLSVYKQKKRVFGVFMGITLAYLALCVAMLVYHISLPYADPRDTLPKAIVYVVSALYVAFIFPFMAIKYSRVRRYFKMLTYVSEGLKTEEKNYFYTFREKSLQKDNIDVVGCVFETWSKKKSEWMEREVYADAEKPLPEFGSGDYVHYIAQSNFVVQYEILEKHAYEFSEYEEDEEYEDEEEDGEGEMEEETMAEGEQQA